MFDAKSEWGELKEGIKLMPSYLNDKLNHVFISLAALPSAP